VIAVTEHGIWPNAEHTDKTRTRHGFIRSRINTDIHRSLVLLGSQLIELSSV
jgi:hypothetical protein